MVDSLTKLFNPMLNNPIYITLFCIILALIGFVAYKHLFTVKENFDASAIGIGSSYLNTPETNPQAPGTSMTSLLSGISSYITGAASNSTGQSPSLMNAAPPATAANCAPGGGAGAGAGGAPPGGPGGGAAPPGGGGPVVGVPLGSASKVPSILKPTIDVEALDALCAGIKQPLKLPLKTKDDISGCGWFFKEDADDFSFPAYGTKEGPINPKFKKIARGGEWFFMDLSGAQKREDTKRCQRIRTCRLADVYPEFCGWCTSLGYGIPLDGSYRSKYPDFDELNCQGTIIRNVTKCPKIDRDKQATRNAKGKIIPAPKILPLPCDENEGKLTRECLKFLAMGAGVKLEGHLINIIMGDKKKHLVQDTPNNRIFKKVTYLLKRNAQLPLDLEFLGNGNCKRAPALQYYVKLVDTVGHGYDEITRQAAAYLVRGQEFPMKKFMENFSGPFDLSDLTTAFKECGGQPAGAGYPTMEQVPNYNGTKLSDIKKAFTRFCVDDVKSKDPTVQKFAVKKCLGVNLTMPVPGCDMKPKFIYKGAGCNPGNSFIGDINDKPKDGVEMFWYSWDNDMAFPERKNPIATFFGREIRLSIPNIIAGDAVSCPFTTTDPAAFIARTNTEYSGEIYNTTYTLTTGEGIALKINGDIMYRNWVQGTAGSGDSNPIKMTPLDANYNEFYWFSSNPKSASLLVNYTDISGTKTYIPFNVCKLRIPKGYPICRWDFFTGQSNEINGILSTKVNKEGTAFAKYEDKNGLQVTGKNSWVMTNNKIRGSAFRTFTAMIYYNEFTSTQKNSFIFSLRKKAEVAGGAAGAGGGQAAAKAAEAKASTDKVVFYSACNFGGKATELGVGEYPFQKLLATGYGNDTLQSVRVPLGLAVTVWEHDIGGGREVTFTADNACLTSINFMNAASSARVIAAKSLASNSAVTPKVEATVAPPSASNTPQKPNYLDGPAIEAGIGENGYVFAVLRPGKEITAASTAATKAAAEAAATASAAGVPAPDTETSDPFPKDPPPKPVAPGAKPEEKEKPPANSLKVKTKDGAIKPGTWTHVALVISTDYTSMVIYIDGVEAANVTGVVDASFYNKMVFDYGSMGLSYADPEAPTAKNLFNGGIAWQHWFDYPLCQEDVQLDFKNQYCNTEVYPVYEDFGWDMLCPLSINDGKKGPKTGGPPGDSVPVKVPLGMADAGDGKLVPMVPVTIPRPTTAESCNTGGPGQPNRTPFVTKVSDPKDKTKEPKITPIEDPFNPPSIGDKKPVMVCGQSNVSPPPA